MKQFTLAFAVFCALCAVSFAGPEQYSGKEMKQVAPVPCPEWYADSEWNVSIWGTYALTGTESSRSGIEDADDNNVFGSYDRFLGGDHAWGGGADVKYFFHRYFGVGIEGFALAARDTHAVFEQAPDFADEEFYQVDHHTVGGVLGTFTLRYPFHCSRFSPYIWVGGGGVFGGHNDAGFTVPFDEVSESRVLNDTESRAVGQFGGGLEVRITRHIGIIGDFSWNVVDGTKNNFGMARTGLNFAF
jgi:hypothetical protein